MNRLYRYNSEKYQTGHVIVTYYPFLESRIRAFSIGLKKSFWMLIASFRLIMRISPSVD